MLSPQSFSEMVMGPNNNSFLRDLLALQQDGKAAISAPRNWDESPLLQVKTDVDDVIATFLLALDEGLSSSSTAPWLFLVGSPGNGKSAGTGELARALAASGYSVTDNVGNDFRRLPEGQIPYLLRVSAAGTSFPCAFIAQDASVVPDPYADGANPVDALVDLLTECEERGIALLVCTNRGVLERAYSKYYLERQVKGKLWFRAIKSAALGEPDFSGKFESGRKHVFKQMLFHHSSLDRRSLLVGRNTFKDLVVKATAPARWGVCTDCQSKSLCPFFNNRNWLVDGQLGNTTIDLIKHAEILSGQVIVFREALALISLILAGCPHDYPDGSPCNWVHHRIQERDFFSLLSRRIYMTIFSAYSPNGLEPHSEDRSRQQRHLLDLANSVPIEKHSMCVDAVKPFSDREINLSADVGVERLVGVKGIFRTMDVFTDIQSSDFYERWEDFDISPFSTREGGFSELERCCAQIWASLKSAAEAKGDASAICYRELMRWATSFTLRAGALVERRWRFSSEIDVLARVLEIDEPNEEDDLLLFALQDAVWRMLHDPAQGTQISAFGFLKGDWLERSLKPKVVLPKDGEKQSIVLGLSFGDQTALPLNARAFVWLKRKIDRMMATSSFPVEYLETAKDSLVKAASESSYHTQNEDVELVVSLPLPSNDHVTLKRSRGRVIVDGV